MTVGQILLIALSAIVILGVIGIWQKKRNPGQESGEDTVGKVTDNVVDLNDRFNRARYQNRDGR